MGSVAEVDVAVVGGGAIGITVALEVATAGRSVRLFDTARLTTGSSHGNAGLLCPSYATPIASPQTLLQGIAGVVAGGGPFSVAKPVWDREIAVWLARFVRACNPVQMHRATELGIDLAQKGIDWHRQFSQTAADYGFTRAGWLYVYQTLRGFRAGLRHASVLASAGVESRALDAAEALTFEPALSAPAGAVYYPGDAHLDPHAYVAAAAECAERAGVDIRTESPVLSVVPDSFGGFVRVRTASETTLARQVVLAAGAFTPQLTRGMGISLPILPGRGYSVSLASGQIPKRPLILAEAHIVVSPMRSQVRMTSGMDLGSFDSTVPSEKISVMTDNAKRYFIDPEGAVTDEWVGFRPMTPDSLPIIGPLAANSKVIVAAGHGTLGMTLAPATAQIVRGILEGTREPAAVSPRRFGC